MTKEEAKQMASIFQEIENICVLTENIANCDTDGIDFYSIIVNAIGREELIEALTEYKEIIYKDARTTLANIGL